MKEQVEGSMCTVEVDGEATVGGSMEVVKEIPAISQYRDAYRKQFGNLSRRVNLLAPMFEELKESNEPIGYEAAGGLARLREAVGAARELLRFGSDGSKIYLVLERDKITKWFQEVSAQLEQALDEISFDKLDISDEVREQVEFVHAQFKRAKECVDIPDTELYSDIAFLYNMRSESYVAPATLERLAAKLQLNTISDLIQESLALHKMAGTSGYPEQSIEKMSMLLKKIKDYVQAHNPEMGSPSNPEPPFSDVKHRVPAIPDDFLCPISLELMKDPVITDNGLTYERACIEKWLDAGHDTCPKTQEELPSTTLTPNYVLRCFIAQWCEANGMDPPQRPSKPCKRASSCSTTERSNINTLIRKLSSPSIDDRRSAAGEMSLLAKRSTDNRICIAEAGAIPLLVNLLSTTDPRTQVHAVTALLNLSIYEDNKEVIIYSGAVPEIVHVLREGSMESRENAAATLYSLSIVDENKVTIGLSGAIPALVSLLNEGSQRGKKDAATALLSLCIYLRNKGRAVRAGVVPTLINLLADPAGLMVGEALAILAMLSSHHECKAVIGMLQVVPMLIEVIKNGSPRNQQNAATVLLHLCSGEQQQQHLAEVQEQNMMDALLELASCGTDRVKRMAVRLRNSLTRFVEQQNGAQAQVQAQAHPNQSSTAFSDA